MLCEFGDFLVVPGIPYHILSNIFFYNIIGEIDIRKRFEIKMCTLEY